MERNKLPKYSHPSPSSSYMNHILTNPHDLFRNHATYQHHNPSNHSFVKKIWRKGKWTEEEEAYAEKIVMAFNAGILDIPPGTTLRSALSELLNYDPMRITKKFSGSCIGKQPYVRRIDQNSPALVELKKELEKTKIEFNSMVERNLELQNSNLLFTTLSPYSQYLSEYLPVIAESGENYHAMLHQHAIASLQLQANLDHSAEGHNSTPSTSDFSHDNYFRYLQPQQQQQYDLQFSAPATVQDWDNEWGIPNLYDPGTSPRLIMLYYSSTPNTPHTTNQPYIYLPPRFSYPLDFPKYTSSLTSDDLIATSAPLQNSDPNSGLHSSITHHFSPNFSVDLAVPPGSTKNAVENDRKRKST